MKKIGIVALAALCTLGAAAVAYANRNEDKKMTDGEDLLTKELLAVDAKPQKVKKVSQKKGPVTRVAEDSATTQQHQQVASRKEIEAQ